MKLCRHLLYLTHSNRGRQVCIPGSLQRRQIVLPKNFGCDNLSSGMDASVGAPSADNAAVYFCEFNQGFLQRHLNGGDVCLRLKSMIIAAVILDKRSD